MKYQERKVRASRAVLPNEIAAGIEAHIKKQGRSTEADLMDAVRGRRQIKIRVLREMLGSRIVARHGAGVKSDPFVYSVVERPSDGTSDAPELEYEELIV